MKRILLFLIIVGIFIGVFVNVRNKVLNSGTDEIVNVVEPEVYIPELNLPLIEVDTLNPILTHNKQVSDVLKLVYEPLISFDEENKIVPTLATEWYEKDAKTWIVKVNTFAKWHSDKNVSIEDVIFTYNAIKKSDDSVYKTNVENIVSMEKIDENAIQINLLEKDRYLIYDLTFPIIPKYYFENDMLNETKNTRMIGTGPYKFQEVSEDGNKINLEANLDWWKNEKLKLEKIYLYKYPTYGEAIKAFKSTEIDVISTTMSSWQKKFGAIGINSYMYESNEFETIIPNTQNVLLSESSVRRMLLEGINSENIVESVYVGNGSISNCPINSNSYLSVDTNKRYYDVEKSKQLLINAGWNNSSGVWKKEIQNKTYTLKFDLLVNKDNEEKMKIANMIVENLKEVGVNIKLVKVTKEEFNKRIDKGNFELALATISLNSDIDILELVTTGYTKNFARYSNVELDNIISNINESNMIESFIKIQEIYKNESPYIGMYYKCNNLLTNKSVKGNIKPTSWNVYHDIIGWCK